jgi:hypothetical protein
MIGAAASLRRRKPWSMISKHAVDDRKNNISIVYREKDVKLFSAVDSLLGQWSGYQARGEAPEGVYV